MSTDTHTKQLQAGGLLLVGLYFLHSARNPEVWRFLDGVNLIIHETGHLVFTFFGEYLGVAGGSLFQVIVPLAFVIGFYIQQNYLSASLVLFWVGQSIINVSVYARDALLMQLPLLGGGHVVHDWNYLLSNIGLLEHANVLANILETIGVMVYIGAIAFGLYVIFFKKELQY